MGTAGQLFGLICGGAVVLAVLGTEGCSYVRNLTVNVRHSSYLHLTCEGLAPKWTSYDEVSQGVEMLTSLENNAGEQISLLLYRSATNSDSFIRCSTKNGSCIDYSVKVFTVPSNVHITDSRLKSNTVQLRTTTTLTCSASGTAPFVYQWRHNGTISAETSSTYRITTTLFSNAGTYTCQVSNWAGNSSGAYTLHVQALPRITSLRSSVMYNKIILRRTKSTTFYINCHVSDGSRPVNFRWELNGVNVNGSIESDGDSGNQVVGRLYISALKPSHQGTYTCFTKNIVGSDQMDIFVTVVDPPFAEIKVNGSLISDGKVHVLNGTVSTFECLARGSPPVKASWSTSVKSINRDLLGGDQMALQLAQDDEGNYTCIVNNTQERLSHPYHVDVRVYDPIHAITITNNKIIESNESSSVTLTCAFFKDPDDPDPFPPVNWTGPSYRSIENATQLSYDMYESSITFEVNRAHYGRFTCSVVDFGVGILYEKIDLKVYYFPVAVDSSTIEVTNKLITSVAVQWTAVKDDYYPIHYYYLRLSTCDDSSSLRSCQPLNTFKSADNTTAYTLENLAPFTVYSLELAAENSVGIGPYSDPVMVQSDGNLVIILAASGGALVVVLLVLAVVVIIVVVGCRRRKRWRRKKSRPQKIVENPGIPLQPEISGKSAKKLENKDPHYAPLDMDKVDASGPYASLKYACQSTDDTFTREYAIPPDAVATSDGLTSEFVDSSSPKTVGTFGKFGGSKTNSAGKKKPKLPKKTSRGKGLIPLAVSNSGSYTMKQDHTSPSGDKSSTSLDTATAIKAPSVASKQEKTGKKKNPLTLPASAKLQSSTVKQASGGTESSSKPSVAELTQRLEKGNL